MVDEHGATPPRVKGPISCQPLMVYGIFQSNEFQLLKSPFEKLGIHQDSNSPKWKPTWECVGSFPHTLLHSREHEI